MLLFYGVESSRFIENGNNHHCFAVVLFEFEKLLPLNCIFESNNKKFLITASRVFSIVARAYQLNLVIGAEGHRRAHNWRVLRRGSWQKKTKRNWTEQQSDVVNEHLRHHLVEQFVLGLKLIDTFFTSMGFCSERKWTIIKKCMCVCVFLCAGSWNPYEGKLP